MPKTLICFLLVGAAQGVNQAAQCVGAILVAPLIKRWPTRSVLSCAIFFFALMTIILLIVDAGTGGSIRKSASTSVDYGSWNPDAVRPTQSFATILLVTYLVRSSLCGPCLALHLGWLNSYVGSCTDLPPPCGVSMFTLSRSPADIVGCHIVKLRRMDAIVVRSHSRVCPSHLLITQYIAARLFWYGSWCGSGLDLDKLFTLILQNLLVLEVHSHHPLQFPGSVTTTASS
jgi:hypothetical protein